MLIDRHSDGASETQPEVLSVIRPEGTAIDEVLLYLHIPATLRWFEGHFPGTPLLPGVVQTHWVVMLARQYFDLPPCLVSMSNMKFMRFIFPDASIQLCLRFAPVRGELTFEYRENDAVCASGRMEFRRERGG